MTRFIIRFIPIAIHHPLVALLGFREGRGDMGMTYDNDPSSDRSVAYDFGRTIRRWDA